MLEANAACSARKEPGWVVRDCGDQAAPTIVPERGRTSRGANQRGGAGGGGGGRYFCMVNFVREGFLGSSADFNNRFVGPVLNGQHENSTAGDVRLMKQRAHVLHKQLEGFVQRRGVAVLQRQVRLLVTDAYLPAPPYVSAVVLGAAVWKFDDALGPFESGTGRAPAGPHKAFAQRMPDASPVNY